MAHVFKRCTVCHDSYGLFLQYGPMKIRPFSPVTTRYDMGDEVSVVTDGHYSIGSDFKVFDGALEYEIWKRPR